MTEEVEADLKIELNVLCPNDECNEYFDLIRDMELSDNGWINKLQIPDIYWAENHDQLELVTYCPHCDEEVKIKGIMK